MLQDTSHQNKISYKSLQNFLKNMKPYGITIRSFFDTILLAQFRNYSLRELERFALKSSNSSLAT